jgi:hypothetical protein
MKSSPIDKVIPRQTDRNPQKVAAAQPLSMVRRKKTICDQKYQMRMINMARSMNARTSISSILAATTAAIEKTMASGAQR